MLFNRRSLNSLAAILLLLFNGALFAGAEPAAAAVPGVLLGVLTPDRGAHASHSVPCVRTTVASVRPPSGPAAYQHGTLRLSNGASVWIEGSLSDSNVVQAVHMVPGDPVAACYGPARKYADAGDARAITVLDLKTSGSYGNAVGNWPGAR